MWIGFFKRFFKFYSPNRGLLRLVMHILFLTPFFYICFGVLYYRVLNKFILFLMDFLIKIHNQLDKYGCSDSILFCLEDFVDVIIYTYGWIQSGLNNKNKYGLDLLYSFLRSIYIRLYIFFFTLFWVSVLFILDLIFFVLFPRTMGLIASIPYFMKYFILSIWMYIRYFRKLYVISWYDFFFKVYINNYYYKSWLFFFRYKLIILSRILFFKIFLSISLMRNRFSYMRMEIAHILTCVYIYLGLTFRLYVRYIYILIHFIVDWVLSDWWVWVYYGIIEQVLFVIWLGDKLFRIYFLGIYLKYGMTVQLSWKYRYYLLERLYIFGFIKMMWRLYRYFFFVELVFYKRYFLKRVFFILKYFGGLNLLSLDSFWLRVDIFFIFGIFLDFIEYYNFNILRKARVRLRFDYDYNSYCRALILDMEYLVTLRVTFFDFLLSKFTRGRRFRIYKDNDITLGVVFKYYIQYSYVYIYFFFIRKLHYNFLKFWRLRIKYIKFFYFYRLLNSGLLMLYSLCFNDFSKYLLIIYIKNFFILIGFLVCFFIRSILTLWSRSFFIHNYNGAFIFFFVNIILYTYLFLFS